MTAKLAPIEATETMWGGLARAIVMWCRFDRPSERALLQHLRLSGERVPDWLEKECRDVDHVPPKGSVAVWIYRAMLDAIPTVSWRHKKRGTDYFEIGRGEFQCSLPGHRIVEGVRLVAYISKSDGKIWFRTEADFGDGRFEKLP